MRKKRLSLVRKRKVIITWHYHPDRKQVWIEMPIVYMGRTQTSTFSLIGFDLKYPDREVPFYDQSVAVKFAEAHKWKIVDKKVWEAIRIKTMKKKGLA